jgi:diguanylate cyclase (GGDEF)-like protein/PAS domain S-box-containing protein
MVYRRRADQARTMEFVSGGCSDLTGYRPADLLSSDPEVRQQLIHPDDRPSVEREIEEALRAKRAFHVAYRLRTAAGQVRWASEHGRGLFSRRGALTAVEGYISDITEQKLAEQLLAEQAIRDALTGLYNRRFFDERIEAELARASRNRHSVAFLMCDLDYFKSVNDAHGHQVGDEVLRAVAGAILSSTRGSDLIVRWGGDEIVVVLAETNESGGRIVAQRIRRAVRRLSEMRGIRFDISMGIAVFPTHGESVDQLIRLADRALYIAKKTGDRLHIGDEHYRLDAQAVTAVFQPIVDVWSNHVLGYEALGRDPEGQLSVAELFNKYHVVGQLEELKTICFTEQLRAGRDAGLTRIFLNVDLGVLERLEPIAKPEGMDVILEISERKVLHDVEGYLSVAMKWRAQGYKFAIDDFGEGFVSLPLVARLTPEYIKIDRSLVLQAVASDTFKGFLKHLLQALRIYATEGVIAEGVETETELAAMKGIGIFVVQGFLTGRPQALLPEPAADAA